jgi:hypothetical protein
MTTLAATKIRGLLPNLFIDPPAIAADIIYIGAAVGADGSGNARPLVAGDPFLGFCAVHADNSAGAAAAIRVHVAAAGGAWLPVANVNSVDDCPCAVYASDDDTFTTVRSGNSYVGKAVFYNTVDSLAFVVFEANKPQAAVTHAPTNASEAVTLNATFSNTEAEAALEALGAKLNLTATALNSALNALELHGLIKTA